MKLFGIKNVLIACGLSFIALTSCSDMLETESDQYIFADGENLTDPTDTIYSMVGILNKLQAVADRTVILGEVRGDLVQLTPFASTELQEVSIWEVGTDNKYNRPRDYYAIINNCNYFLAHADTALKNNRGEHIFLKEYAAVKAVRAWTYLQLGLVYGRVPFVARPLTSMEVKEDEFPLYDLEQICRYFISDLTPYVNTDMPGYGSIGSVDSRLCYFPIHLLLGELNLWVGNYRQAALSYYHYISSRGGTNTAWPLATRSVNWMPGEATYTRYDDSWSLASFSTSSEAFTATGELVTMIPGDSVVSSPYYSELPDLWNTTTSNEGYYSLTPSVAMQALSRIQIYCNQTTDGEVYYAPNNLPAQRAGDLRLMSVWDRATRPSGGSDADRPLTQEILKFSTPHVHLWRCGMVYLRLAEAVNRAGFPQFAYNLLATGVNNHVMDSLQRAYPQDSVWLDQFDFPNTAYVLRSESPTGYTTLGVHSRGCGYTELNQSYPMPAGTLDEQIQAVEDLIIDECALELAFEGHRFYDLMRVALRRSDPSYLATRVAARLGQDVPSGITVDLTDTQNWYLKMP